MNAKKKGEKERGTRGVIQKIIAFCLVFVLSLSITTVFSQKQTLAATPQKAIYILPGYMESQLFSKKFANVPIWVGSGLVTEIGLDALRQQSEFTNNATGIGMSAYADRKKDPAGVLGLFLPMITSLKTSLAANGLSDEYTVEFFSYNWLADLNDTAKELAADISAKGYSEIVLICHSNGGLLASAYISQNEENKNKVEKAICIAAALWGTYTALEPLETGAVTLMDGTLPMGLLESGYDVFVKPISKHWVQSWAKNSPNTYQLLAGNEYVSRIPLLNRTSTGIEAVTNAADYYELLKKSPNINSTLLSGGHRSLKYLREDVYGEDILHKWEGVDLTMIGCEYGFITPVTAVYHQSGAKEIYDGSIYNKEGDSILAALSMKGDGFYKWVNLPGASHVAIILDPRTLCAVNDIILGKPVYSSTDTSLFPATSSLSPSIGMSDMIRVEIKSSDPLVFPTLTNAGIGIKVYNNKGSIVARAQGSAQFGFSLNNFIYSSWSTSENATNIICYIPKSGYKLEVFSTNANRLASNLKVFTITLDRSGGFLSQNEYKVSGANLLTGSAFILDTGKSMTPVAALGSKVVMISQLTFKQQWQFSPHIFEMIQGTAITPTVSGADAASMVASNYSWTSSNQTVATVSTDGVITAIAPGKAVITAAAKDSSFKIESVTVYVLSSE
ncbi:MAG: Ig-like domain-containing protein [Clostridiales bacterium]|nr:Ig-like domain-containing protein [Clostridiales bacterium]